MKFWIFIWLLFIFLPVGATLEIRPTPHLPEDGVKSPSPAFILRIEDIGNGYSSPALSDSLIYVTGEVEGRGYIQAFNWRGELMWKECYGPEWIQSFKGSRAAPVVDQSRLYVCSGLGKLLCYHALTGDEIWSIDLVNDFGGKNVSYGYSMPVTIDGDKLFCSPGGPENNIVALNKYSGELIWSCPAFQETAGYGSPLVIHRGELNILLVFSEFMFLGIHTSTGEVLWSYALNFKGELPCNAPLYKDGVIYIAAGPGNGSVAFQLAPDGFSIKKLWENPAFDPFFGGFVMVGDFLVGSANSSHTYVSLDRRTGQIISRIGFGTGASVSVNDTIAAYNQKGQVGIMKLKGKKFILIYEFTVSEGTGEHFAIPVFSSNKLLIRHGNSMLGYQL